MFERNVKMWEKIKMVEKKYSWIKYGKMFMRMVRDSYISAHASSAAFFLFLSLIPMIIIVCALIPEALLVKGELANITQSIIPERIFSFVMELISIYKGNNMTILSVSAVITVWSASKGMLALIRGMNFVYAIQESRRYILLRIRAFVYTMFLLLAIIASFGILVLGNSVAGVLSPSIQIIADIWKWLSPFRHILVAAFISVMFCTLYCLLPNKRLPWREQLPGAVFTSVFWAIYSFAFSVYIEHFGGFSMYGSLTTVVIVMIWLYFCMYIFFCGALVNRFLNEHFDVF